MAERLKDQFFTRSSVNALADTIKKIHPDFDKEKLIGLVFDSTWESKELKEMMRHTTECLHATLPESYKDALDILMQAAPHVKGFEALTLPDYVALYGMDDWDASLPALGYLTKYATSELAVRPFLAKDPERVMAYMRTWAEDPDPNVRRLASEGCRPRLPWAMALPAFKKDPSPIRPILEKLKDDASEFVRRSVANNLNDISKDHTEWVLDICERWMGRTKQTDDIVKHACRGVLKAGHTRAMRLFGFGDPAHMRIEQFTLDQNAIFIGDTVHFSFELVVGGETDSKVRLEYLIYFMKANGKLSKKVFQITENGYSPGKYTFKRKHAFVDMTTRKHHAGRHEITVVVNGVEKAKTSLELQENVSA